jgi:alpha-tubulin suppressor-like RCC1 family protein
MVPVWTAYWRGTGELGTGQPELLQHPFADTDVVGLSSAVGIGSGGIVSGTSCALLSTGSAMCWGYGASGQLGNSASTSSRSPVPVGGLLGAIGGGVGREHVCANLASGGVLCWGAGTLGQLGDGIGLGSNTPVSVSGISTARTVGSGPAAQHSCAMLDDFSVWCWGRGHQGQLGDGAAGAGVFRTTPYRVSGF